MTKEKAFEALTKYHDLVVAKFGVRPTKSHPGWYTLFAKAMSIQQQAQHVSWMCIEAKKFLEVGRTEKAMRWLGFIQGWLWTVNIKVLDDLKKDLK